MADQLKTRKPDIPLNPQLDVEILGPMKPLSLVRISAATTVAPTDN